MLQPAAARRVAQSAHRSCFQLTHSVFADTYALGHFGRLQRISREAKPQSDDLLLTLGQGLKDLVDQFLFGLSQWSWADGARTELLSDSGSEPFQKGFRRLRRITMPWITREC